MIAVLSPLPNNMPSWCGAQRQLYLSPNVISVIKSRRWDGRACSARRNTKNAWRNL